ncbi:MAG TPA: Imm70 family immunity protein [Pyrinomonadaceae bacterium]|jgi:hypothetical protein|nr:Imm70 family immunity protein [Pyrinomonadaceae bacterium]
MGVAIWVGETSFPIGSPSFFKSFFSTVYVRVEKQWASKYPVLMNELYAGRVEHDHCDRALEELADVRRRLADFPPDQVVWDFEDLSSLPPWGDQISPTITSLANYFWTSDGQDLIEVLVEAFDRCKASRKDAVIR